MLSDIDVLVDIKGSPDTSQDRLLDTVDKLNCQLQWPGQIGFISVSLCVLLRAYQFLIGI